MSISFNFEDVLRSVVQKAKEDNIITKEEEELLKAFRIQGQNLHDQIEDVKGDQNEKIVLQKILASSSRILLKNLVSKAREDGRISSDEKKLLEILFKELGFDLNNFDSRPWYNFKICLNIDETTPMNDLLDHFDKIFCLRGINPNDVYSGLCLGTKHYVIEDVDVTLLTFAITPETTQEWVTKGAFAVLSYTDNFERLLYTTAYDLVVENYLSKIV